MCEPFSSACVLASIARVLPKGSPWDDSEKLFPLSKNKKGGIPYSGTLLLSLASEKEGSRYIYPR
jgi:hypothetical protein